MTRIDPSANTGLAYSAAQKLSRRMACSTEDLVGYAYIALADAADGFDASKGYKFSTYAHSIIHFRLFRSLMEDRGYRRRMTNGRGRWEPAIRNISLGTHPDGASRQDDIPSREQELPKLDEALASELVQIADELAPTAGEMMRYLVRGVPKAEACKIVGRSRSYVSMVLAEVAARLEGKSLGGWKMPGGPHPKG